jgi:hypothetical protein
VDVLAVSSYTIRSVRTVCTVFRLCYWLLCSACVTG